MAKKITDSQILGELGETAVKKIVLEMRFIYDPRGRLEAGTDGIIELRDPKSGAPLGKLLGVQVKATGSGQYIRETDRSAIPLPEFVFTAMLGRFGLPRLASGAVRRFMARIQRGPLGSPRSQRRVAPFGITRCGASGHPSPNSSVRIVSLASRHRCL